jgi:iron complex transport system permease protein
LCRGATVLTALIGRPLSVLTLDGEGARSLGLSLCTIRPLALGLAVSLSAFVVSAVGIIGFIGLGAPALARLSGARRIRDQLIVAPLMGAALLWLTDQVAESLLASHALAGGTRPSR